MDQTVSIRNIFWSAVKKWRAVLVTSLCFAVLFGAGKAFSMYRTLNDDELLRKSNAEVFEKLKDYKDKKINLEKDIETLKFRIENDEKYLDESLLMKINPMEKHTASVNIYLDSNYQIMPDKMYQTPNPLSRLMRSYIAYIENGDMYNACADMLKIKKDIKYLMELVTYKYDYSTGFITINVSADTEESCQKLANSVIDFMKNKKAIVEDSIAEHKMTFYDVTVQTVFDTDLKNQQNSVVTTLNDNKNKLAYEQDELFYLKKPDTTELSKVSIVTGGVKFGVLGFVLGTVVYVGALFVIKLISNTVDDEVIRKVYNISIISSKPYIPKTKNQIDRLISRISEQSSINTEDEFKKFTATSLSVSFTNNKDIGNIHFTGSIPSSELKNFYDSIVGELGNNIKTTCGGFIFDNAGSLLDTGKSDAIVIVEKKNRSSYRNLEKELDKINELGKTVLGIILL